MNVEYLRTKFREVDELAEQVYFAPRTDILRPGDVFAFLIRKITHESLCTRCAQRKNWMNHVGWWECWKQRELIIKWLTEEARLRGHDVTEQTMGNLFKIAVKELHKVRRDEARRGNIGVVQTQH